MIKRPIISTYTNFLLEHVEFDRTICALDREMLSERNWLLSWRWIQRGCFR